MESIGQILKKARLAKGLTIEELQQITKIQTKYLVALEEDDYDAMPSMFYARTFVKQYATEVGVDPNYLINRFDGKPTTETQQLTAVRGSRSELYKGRHGSRQGKTFKEKLPLIILFLVSALIIGGVAYLTLKEKNQGPLIDRPKDVEVADGSSTTSSSTHTTTTESTATTTSSTEPPKEAPSFELVFGSEEGKNSTVTLNHVKKPLKFEFTGGTGASWLGILVDGDYIYDHTVGPGETATAEVPAGTTAATLILGASNHVSVKLNGQDFEFNPHKTGTIQRNIILTINYDKEETN